MKIRLRCEGDTGAMHQNLAHGFIEVDFVIYYRLRAMGFVHIIVATDLRINFTECLPLVVHPDAFSDEVPLAASLRIVGNSRTRGQNEEGI